MAQEDGPSILALVPPLATERVAPPLATHVRVIATYEVLTVHAYYITPSRLVGPDAQVEGDVATIETEPVARIALPASTAAELAFLILRNLAASAVSLPSESLSRMRDYLNKLHEPQDDK